MKRPLALAAVGAAAALALAGCTAGAPEESAGPVELTFWHGYTEADGDVLQQIVDDFNASQEDVEIKTGKTERRLATTAQTVGAALAEAKIRVDADDISSKNHRKEDHRKEDHRS